MQTLLRAAVDVYLLEETSKALELPRSHRRHIIKPMEYFKVGGFGVAAFPGHHDCEVVGFQISAGDEKLVYITDTCYCEYNFSGVTHWLVECNYTVDQLAVTALDHPERVKRVIQTHLGEENVIQLLQENDLSSTVEVRLCHLSDENADEKQMAEHIGEILPDGVKLTVAKK